MTRWVILIFLITGCKHDCIPPSCNDISWQTAIKDNIASQDWKGEIYSMMYHGDVIFYINGCTNCSDFVTSYYNCAGEIICSSGGITGANNCPSDLDNAADRKLIWSN